MKKKNPLFETALAYIPLATAILDGVTLRIRWANRAFADFVDEAYRGVPLAGLPLADVMGHISASGLADIMCKVAATGRSCSDLRYVYLGPQRAPRYWRFSLQPLPGEAGEMMLHVEDVTGNMTAQRPTTVFGANAPVRIVAKRR